MMMFSQLESITGGKILRLANDAEIVSLHTDSRKAIGAEGAVFFAIRGEHHNGHHFVKGLYEHGVRQFVLEATPEDVTILSDANILLVESSIRALQAIASHHRAQLNVPVVGITGSNGKTIVKEWLFQLLSEDYKIAKNPGSYNSQLGVPLSVWQLRQHHEFGIFEAGISRPGEMEKLAAIIQPTLGIFTNIGSAHDEGFKSQEQKINEKVKLFSTCKVVVYCKDNAAIDKAIENAGLTGLSWGASSRSGIQIKVSNGEFSISFKGKSVDIILPFKDKASIENCFHCVAIMIHLGYSIDEIQKKIRMLQSVPMRLELKEGINQSYVIDDTYNNDLAGLQIGLEFLSNQQQKNKKRVILSDILESGLSEDTLTKQIAQLIATHSIQSLVGVGRQLTAHKKYFPEHAKFYSTTEDFLANFDWDSIQQEIILVKGARSFQFEKIVERLQRRVHGTIMEIDLGAVIHNLNFFKARLKSTTKIMVMVKAFAYGSGSTEIANLLQYHKVDYLGVAYADEGVELRKNNISIPIMVMNPTEESFATMLQHKLEPEIFSFKILHRYLNFLQGRNASIHIKLDTGMHRLGFDDSDIEELVRVVSENSNLKIASIFSHMAGADEAVHDEFSKEQVKLFERSAKAITDAIGYKPLFHILNSPGILRLPQYQMDMVRLGIGLYGVDPTSEKFDGLKPVATLKTIVSQIKHIKQGDTIGYGRRGKAEKPMTIATIAIGYADGFSRSFSRGAGKVLINDKLAPVIGNVCMDMTMINVTDLHVQEGDEVIIFGPGLPIQQVAEAGNTIPYEILTNTSERVKRIFVAESM
jgi:Alr-MurF fusion protein